MDFPSNGMSATGYLASPSEKVAPGVVVIQEWWGLVGHIKDVCDRFAANGFYALAPDLYHGNVASEPDGAAKAMMAMELPSATKDMSGAVTELIKRSGGSSAGVVGFCMGGALALMLAADRPDVISAVSPFYGVVSWPSPGPDFQKISGAIQGHYAEHDDSAPPEASRALESRLRSMGKEVEFFVYPGTHHAFFNDTRPEVYDPHSSKQAWDRLIPFLKEHIR
ncbi:MAG: dienelactone hydrolase family protein [Acidimicrobiaceae bacterium]|nr:dienelactone hydrolase family protein [Acidimicrobiaceae bacterium]